MEEQKINNDISYTNKDFQSIYTELLDTVKKLTNKWDPSLSNESDPGVVLLKLNALIADKNNYNIDKNVLECFPSSVTQLGNARKLYDLLGYNMKYYFSAQTDVYFKLKNTKGLETENSSFTIPQFTQLTNSTGDVSYTTLTEVKLRSDNVNTEVEVPVIEGSIQDYDINGETLITINNLDQNLRLYFQDSQIAQNGIFIKKDKDTNFDLNEWRLVDNLSSYAAGSTVYEFGVKPDSNLCYIQFPQDIADLMESGLRIKYIISSGTNGNIKANILGFFSNDLTSDDGEVINDQIKINQPSGATDGSDPETISEAYNNFKRTIGTFTTLVSKRDYENYIFNKKDQNRYIASNIVVSDRTDDLNYSNVIKTRDNLLKTRNKYVVDKYNVTATEKADTLNAYNIVLYMLNNPTSIYDKETYDSSYYQSFLTIDDEDFEDIKSVQHDVLSPASHSTSGKFIYDVLYPLNGTLITYYKITEAEKKIIEQNVLNALYTNFYSRKLLFGTQIEYEDLINVIQNADDRIKTVILDLPVNTPELIDLSKKSTNMYNDITSDNPEGLNEELIAKMVLSGNVQLFKFDDNFDYDFGQKNGTIISKDNNTDIDMLTTNLDVTVNTEYGPVYGTGSSKTVGLRENESIQILSPSLITSIEYSTYVKYALSATNAIPSNVDYKLKDNEYILIKYTDSNGAKQDTIIKSGDIINSNITLEPSPIAEKREEQSYNQLKSGEYIRLRTLNEAQLQTGTNYYFILNNIQREDNNNYYKLYLPAGDSYILSENEYFIYTNSNSTEMIILGSGTKLTNNGTANLNAEIKQIDISTITTEDIQSIEWKKLPENVTLLTTELIITNLAEGAQIKSSSGSYPLTNDPLNTDLGVTITYKASNTSDEVEITDNIGEGLYLQSRLALNANQYKAQKLESNQSIDFKFKDEENYSDSITNTSILFNAPIITSGGKDLSVQVVSSSGNVSYLKAYQFTQSDIATDTTINRDSDNLIVLKDGRYWQLNYNFKAQDNLTYSYLIPIQINLNPTTDKKIQIDTNRSGQASTEFKVFGSDKGSMRLTSGIYFLQVPIDTDCSNMYIDVLNKEGTAAVDLAEDESIIIGKIIKFNGLNSEEINSKDALHDYKIEDHYQKVLSEIKDIDTDNIFDWGYLVPEEDKVKYPVKASSYWDLNHVYNKYTIPKIDFNNYSITVHSSSVIKGA